jgi:hypothetical protein
MRASRQVILVACVGMGLLVVGCRSETRANPLGFPDLSSYSRVNIQDYTISIPNPPSPAGRVVYFLTPDGITCDFTSPAVAQCTGNNFPSIPPVTPASAGVNWIRTDEGLSQTSDALAPDHLVQGHPIASLPPLHSITVDGVVCGVDNAGTTACKDPQGRGFVLSPQGSGWLPHV